MFARTERLLLRPGWPEDAPALAAAIADERVLRNLSRPPCPYTLADAEGFLARAEDALPSLQIHLRTDGAPRLIGGIGLHPDERGIELGYWLTPSAWGRGYATEAGRAIVAMAASLGIDSLVSAHFVDNPASGRVLAKLGFVPTGEIAPRFCRPRGHDVQTILVERRTETRALAA